MIDESSKGDESIHIKIPEMGCDRILANAEKAWHALMETPSSNEVLAALGLVTGWIHTELASWKTQNALAKKERP
jgi:hypothetical protein